jgi:hypothetical protein
MQPSPVFLSVRSIGVLLLTACVATPTAAEEGMWPLHQVPAAAWQTKHGLAWDDALRNRVQPALVRV